MWVKKKQNHYKFSLIVHACISILENCTNDFNVPEGQTCNTKVKVSRSIIIILSSRYEMLTDNSSNLSLSLSVLARTGHSQSLILEKPLLQARSTAKTASKDFFFSLALSATVTGQTENQITQFLFYCRVPLDDISPLQVLDGLT